MFPFLGKPSIAFAEGSCVGGGTVINGGLIWRTPSWILEDWQDNYGLEGYGEKDLLKYFETVEQDMHVIKSDQEEDANLDSLKLLKASEELGWKYDDLYAIGTRS